MSEEYIIDGTSIIKKAEKERTLTPLLQLLLTLKQQGNNFYCYFDADTRYQFERDIDKQMYQNIIKFGIDEHFVQVSNLDADLPLLEQANVTESTIISCDNFESFYENHPWLSNPKRVVKAEVIAEQLIIESLSINVEVERNLVKLATDLIQILEKDAGRLEGKVDKYKKDRDFGFIKRTHTDKNIFFSKNSVADKKLDFTVIGTEVTFKIDIGNSGSIYYFCATEVREKEAIAPEKAVEQLVDENKILKATKDKIQEQTAEVKAKLENQIQSIQEQYAQLEQENQSLAEELKTYKGSNNETIKRLEAQKTTLQTDVDDLKDENLKSNELIAELRQEIEALKKERTTIIASKKEKEAESNELAVVVNVQKEKLQDLDDDLKNTLQMFEFQDLDEAQSVQYQQLIKDYQIAVNTLKRKNAKIVFLTNNVNDLRRQIVLNHRQSGGQDPTENPNIDELMTRIQELERVNAELSIKRTRKPSTSRRNTNNVEGNQSDSPYVEGPSSSRPTKLKKSPKPREVKIIPYQELFDWWHNLNQDWQKAFNQGVLSRGEILQIPSEEQLRGIFERKKIDIVGSGILIYGLNQLSFKLKDISGLKDLNQITELNLSGHDFTDMKGIHVFSNLELLNCTSNRISSLQDIKKLENLKTLIIRDNDLINLDGAEEIEELEYLNALYNQKLRSIAGVEDLENLQVLCVPNYKTRIIKQLEKLKKANPTVEIKNV
jgi:cold shock CspA family protein